MGEPGLGSSFMVFRRQLHLTLARFSTSDVNRISSCSMG
jgi:hypothetical protein